MNRNIRLGLLTAAAAGFLILAPLIILYAVGFRPSGRTSILIVESTPRRADVFVDGQSAGRSPQVVSNLSSSAVALNLSLDGYIDWTKTVPIEPARSNEFRSIRLFPEAIEPVGLAEGVQSFSLAPNRELVAIVGINRRFQILDGEGSPLTEPVALSDFPTSLLWSPNSASILLEYDSRAADLYTVSSNTKVALPFSDIDTRRSLAWDPRIPGRLLILRPNQTLVAFDTASNSQTTLASNIAAFAPSSRSIYTITSNGELALLNLRGEEISRPPVALDQPVDSILVAPSGFVAIIFADQSLAMLDQNMEVLPVAGRVEQAGFSPDGQLLYLQTAHNELAVYNIEDDRLPHIPLEQVHLVTRLSESISHPQWFAGGQHLIYQVADRIIVTEIDTRDHAISTTLDSTNTGNAMVAVGPQGDSLFYLKKDGSQSRLVKTPLILEN